VSTNRFKRGIDMRRLVVLALLVISLSIGLFANSEMSSCADDSINGAKKSGERKVIIHNTGSTNTASFEIVMSRAGKAKFVVFHYDRTDRGTGELPSGMVNKFFKDLDSAMPISTQKGGNCLKSISFGSSTYVIYKGETSPDITCSG